MTQQTAVSHTPGPWNLSGVLAKGWDCEYINADGPRCIATVHVPRGHPNIPHPAETAEANARLIAAAPKYFAALRDMALSNYDIRDFSVKTLETLKEIREAINGNT